MVVETEFKNAMENHLQDFPVYFYKLLFCEICTLIVSFLSIATFCTWISDVVRVMALFWNNNISVFEAAVPRHFNCTVSYFGKGGGTSNLSTICTNSIFVMQREALFYLMFLMALLFIGSLLQFSGWVCLFAFDRHKR